MRSVQLSYTFRQSSANPCLQFMYFQELHHKLHKQTQENTIRFSEIMMIIVLIIIQIVSTANKDIESYVSRLKQILVPREEVTQKMTQHLLQDSFKIKV